MKVWQDFIVPILQYCFDYKEDSVKRKILIEDVANIAKLSELDKQEKLGSGELRYKNRISWAIWHLNLAGYIYQTAFAQYKISELGIKIYEEYHNKKISSSNLGKMVKENAINALEKNPKIIPDENNNIDSNDSSKDLKEYDDNPEILKINLLNKVKDLTPYDFEKLCIKIICNVYQVNEEELSELTKKSHDGGIDGIVSLDPLGFKKIYIQAKRYDGANVTDRIVRDFAGALDGKKADGGVIITTSKFNNAARITAERSEYNIILIDDDKLINLMIENKIGVRVKKTIEILDISDDFFDELQSDNDE